MTRVDQRATIMKDILDRDLNFSDLNLWQDTPPLGLNRFRDGSR